MTLGAKGPTAIPAASALCPVRFRFRHSDRMRPAVHVDDTGEIERIE